MGVCVCGCVHALHVSVCMYMCPTPLPVPSIPLHYLAPPCLHCISFPHPSPLTFAAQMKEENHSLRTELQSVMALHDQEVQHYIQVQELAAMLQESHR